MNNVCKLFVGLKKGTTRNTQNANEPNGDNHLHQPRFLSHNMERIVTSAKIELVSHIAYQVSVPSYVKTSVFPKCNQS